MEWSPKDAQLTVAGLGGGWQRVVMVGPVKVRLADYKEYAVDLGGKPYMQVVGLINMWRDAHGVAARELGRAVKNSVDVDIVRTGVEEIDSRYVVAKAVVNSDLVGGPFVGWASSIVLTEAEKKALMRQRRLTAEETNPIEVACTSAIGRALRAAGLDLGATYEEMVEAMRRQPVEAQAATKGQEKTEGTVDANEQMMRVVTVALNATGDNDFVEAYIKSLQEQGKLEQAAKLADAALEQAVRQSAAKYAARQVSNNDEAFVQAFYQHFVVEHPDRVEGKDMAGLRELAEEAWKRWQDKKEAKDDAAGPSEEGNS